MFRRLVPVLPHGLLAEWSQNFGSSSGPFCKRLIDFVRRG